MLLAALALQAAATPPERFSILVPVASEPCVRKAEEGDIVVCADPVPSQTLPLPNEAISPNPVASNPELSGSGAMKATASPCASLQGGCQVGFGPPIVPMIKGAVGLVKDALRRKPDRTGRVPIPLDDPAPAPAASAQDVHP